MKGRTASLKFLQNREFLQSKNAQLGELLVEMESPEQDHIQQVYQPQPPKAQPPDSLSLLISRARQATNKKLKKSKKEQKRQVEQKDKGPFLTGVDPLIELEDKAESPHQIEAKDMLDAQVMSILRKKTLEDDLLLLKKEINATKGTLLSYEKQVLGSKKEVSRLAGRYNSYFNLNLPVNKPTVDFSRYSLGMKSLKSIFAQKQ